MRYTVVSYTDTDDRLAELWLSASNRRRISQASDQIDAELRNDAHLKGSEIAENIRLIVKRPLAALFEVSQDDRQVRVLEIARS